MAEVALKTVSLRQLNTEKKRAKVSIGTPPKSYHSVTTKNLQNHTKHSKTVKLNEIGSCIRAIRARAVRLKDSSRSRPSPKKKKHLMIKNSAPRSFFHTKAVAHVTAVVEWPRIRMEQNEAKRGEKHQHLVI